MSVWNHHLIESYDALIVGAGYTGLQVAIELKASEPHWRIGIVDQLPFGAIASSRNAGFACFGSAGEILDDLNQMDRVSLVDLISSRFHGIQRLALIPEIDAHSHGGYEVFTPEETAQLAEIMLHLSEINQLVEEATGVRKMFLETDIKHFNTAFLSTAIYCSGEFQLNAGLLYRHFYRQCVALGIFFLRPVKALGYLPGTALQTDFGNLPCKRLAICTNGLTSSWLNPSDIKPARAQVMVTKALPKLAIKGNFHATKGFYYFRNFGDRLLIGGGRQTDIAGETTTTDEVTLEIMSHLKDYIHRYILPGREVEIDQSWAGIMGLRPVKSPLVERRESGVYMAAGFGGMGVALSGQAASDLAQLILEDRA